MCKKSSFGCLLSEESFILPSNHGIGTFYTVPGPVEWRGGGGNIWPPIASFPAPSRAGVALFSGSWYRIKAESLSMKRPGYGGVEMQPFLLPPHLYMLLFIRLVLSISLPLHELQHARLHYPSLFPGDCSNSCSLSWWHHPTISSSITPFSSCPQSFFSLDKTQHQGLVQWVGFSHQVA